MADRTHPRMVVITKRHADCRRHRHPHHQPPTTVHRRAGADMAPVRAALAALRADAAPATRAALDRLATTGHVAPAEGADQMLERAVADWYTERRKVVNGAKATSGAPDRADPDGANGAPTPNAPTTTTARHRRPGPTAPPGAALPAAVASAAAATAKPGQIQRAAAEARRPDRRWSG